MHRRKKKSKYYSVRAEIMWGNGLVIGILIAVIFGIIYKENFNKDLTTNRDHHLKSDLDDITLCYLCGNSNESLMGYYRKFDTIGLISLNDWYVLDFHLKAYDENGIEIEESTFNNSTFGKTKEISYSSQGIITRGMAEIDVTMPEKYKLNTRFLEKHLCQECLEKVAGSLQYWKDENEKKESIPLCLIDFDTLEVYSLQDYYRSYFIRDYYIKMEFDRNEIKVEAFYLPEKCS